MAHNEVAWRITKKHMPTHYLGPSGPCCERCSRAYAIAVDALRYDYPEADATDFAHPAWTRGNEAAHLQFVDMVNRILDGEVTNAGVSHMPWEALRQRLYDLRTLLGIGQRFRDRLALKGSMLGSTKTWDKVRRDYAKRRAQLDAERG